MLLDLNISRVIVFLIQNDDLPFTTKSSSKANSWKGLATRGMQIVFLYNESSFHWVALSFHFLFMNKLSNNKFHLFFMYIIILGYLFIPRFIVADDVLCPNKDEQGNKSCGYYKKQCEYTRESYEQTV